MSADNEEPIPEQQPELSETDALKAEIAALKDQSLRLLAEAENIRKRAERERNDVRQYGIAGFARALLPVADNFARALAACPPDQRTENEGLKAVLDGVEATARQLQGVLEQNGVKLIVAEGQRFDPNLHQAIAEIPGSGKAPGTVIGVVQDGYVIGDRLLRPAMVTVAATDRGTPSGGNGTGTNGTGAQFDKKI